MKTLIILRLSDLGLHCLPRPICPKIYDTHGRLAFSDGLSTDYLPIKGIGLQSLSLNSEDGGWID